MSKSKTTSKSSSTLSHESNQNHTLVSLYDIDDVSPRHCGYCNENGNVSIGNKKNIKKFLADLL
jgi:hypothetical protein